MEHISRLFSDRQIGEKTMFLMAMVLFGYIVCSMILPLKISWKYKAAMALAIFVIAQKNGILRRIGGGLVLRGAVCAWVDRHGGRHDGRRRGR